ncbi:MAG: hypothetical protein R3C04_09350 [Hyphomonas sp.]
MKSQMTASELLFAIQKQQLHHDENYHREIARLPMPHRLQHMALHISKYFARLVAGELDDQARLRLWTDAFIISVSTCNILNRKLEDIWGVNSSSMSASELAGWIDRAFSADDLPSGRIRRFAECTEQMANACEKMDHIEEFSYRSAISASVGGIAGEAAAEIQKCGDLFEVVTSRLDGVKSKSIFHGA